MNIYIIVEGEIGEAKVYKAWVPLVNPSLTYVSNIFDICTNNFSILSGGGFPNYFDVIDAAIDDVNTHNNIDRLVIAIDSEDFTFQEKYDEINHHISRRTCSAHIAIIVQHFCLETWALGNQSIVRQNSQCDKLRNYMRLFNVRNNDPELLPELPEEDCNRAQFAERYLRRALNDKYRNLSYSKSNPEALLHPKFFERVSNRLHNTSHIASFQYFLSAFV